MINFKQLKDQVDLVELLSRYTTLKKVGANEYHGPCPFCHGDDRFVVIANEQRWFCRKGDGHCGRSGDCFDFTEEAENLDRLGAYQYLSNGYLTHGDPVKPMKSAKDKAPTYAYDWTEQKRKLQASHEALLANKLATTDECRTYLDGRGITEDTLKAFWIGWEDKRLANSKQSALAIALPWFDRDGNLFAIKFRYLAPQTYVDDIEAQKEKPKERIETKTSRGSTKGQVFGLQAFRPDADTLVIVEGEFNALSIWQATPFAVLSLGSKSAFRDLPADLKELAAKFKRVIVWTDEQADSENAAYQLPGALILVSQEVDGRKMDANACLVAGTLPDVLNTAQPLTEFARDVIEIRQKREQEKALKESPSYPYSVRNGQLIYHSDVKTKIGYERKDVLLADFVATITQEQTGEYGERYYVIEGTAKRGGPFRVEIDAEEYSDPAKLVAKLDAAAGAKDTVYSRQRTHIGPAIKKLTPDDVKQTRVYHRTGWIGLGDSSHFLMPGREPVDVAIKVAERLPYAFDEQADLTKGLQCLDQAFHFLGDKGTVVLAAFLLPPLAYHADLRSYRYALFLRGLTGAYKTATLKLFMCLYGKGWISDENLIKLGLGTTANAVMSMATQASDLPFPIDNYKPNTGNGAKDLINLVHALLEGGEKDRLQRTSELKNHKPIWAWPVMTGEDIPREDAATLARTLVLLFKPLDLATLEGRAQLDHLSEAQGLARHLCAVGAAWVDWLATPEAQEIIAGCDFEAMRRQYTEMIIAKHPNAVNPSRIATSLALNHFAWTILANHPTLGEFARQYEQAHDAALAALIHSAVETTTHSLEAERFLMHLRGLMGSEILTLLPKGEDIAAKTWTEKKRDPAGILQDIVHSTPRTQQEIEHIIGWEDGNGGAYLVRPDIVIETVKRYSGDLLGNLTKNAIYDQLDRLGMIASKGKDQTARVIWVGKKSIRVLHLSAKALAEAEAAAQEG